ncbi:MAG: glycoside hydrolase family 3 protein [Spirochaetaceae bacterium]
MIPTDNSTRVTTLVFIILFSLCGADISVSAPTFFSETHSGNIDEEVRTNHIDRLVSSMDDTELLGQIFLLAYTGTSPSDQILTWIEEKKIGGVKIFGWNAEDLEELSIGISTMQREAARNRLSIPLFVATDQEGGWVRHVKSSTSITPGNMAIGASGLPHDAFWTGYYIAKELKAVGINMNFAPTVDVYSNMEAHVIGPRAFSESPVETANLAVAYYMGMEKAGVISTAKHFPGHGNATEDSHGTLPRIDTPFSVLWDRELLPYRFLIKRDIPAIMSGHLSFPAIEEDIPASLSSYFLEEVLRERMGFSGIVITDDMRMYGATNTDHGTPDSCLRAFKAGNDIIMLSRDYDMYRRVWDLFYEKLKEEDGFRENIEKSVRRILKVKYDYLIRENSVPLFPEEFSLEEEIPSREGSEFFFNQAGRSVSIIRDKHIPVVGKNTHNNGEDRILIAGQLRTFLRTGSSYFPRADTYYFPYTPFFEADDSVIEELKNRAQNYDTIIFCLANPNSSQVLEGLSETEAEVVVLSTLTPSYLQKHSWVETAVAVYGPGEDSAIAGFATLKGEIRPEGRVPFFLFEER